MLIFYLKWTCNQVRIQGSLGARAPRVKKRKRREREMMLVSYYNLNNKVFAICSEGNNVKMQIFSKENGHVEVTHKNYVFYQF